MDQLITSALTGLVGSGPAVALLLWALLRERKQLDELKKENAALRKDLGNLVKRQNDDYRRIAGLGDDNEA